MKAISDKIEKKHEENNETVFIGDNQVPLHIFSEVAKYSPHRDLGSYAQSCSAFFKVARQESKARAKSLSTIFPKINIFRNLIDFCSQDNILLTFYPKGHLYKGTKQTLQKKYPEEKFISIGQGLQHVLLLSEEGDVYTKGFGENEPLQRVTGFREDEKIILVAAGCNTNYGLTSQGDLYAWGDNKYGQLGLGHERDCATPQKVTALENKKIVAIAVGAEFILALSNDNKVYAWGDNDRGQLGLDTLEKSYNTPQEVIFFKDMPVNAIYAVGGQSFVITEERVFAFGCNRFQQLGLGQDYPVHDVRLNVYRYETTPFYKSPQAIPALDSKPVVMLATSPSYTLALTASGELLAWGSNIHASRTSTPSPLKLEAFKDKRVLAVFAQDYNYVALTAEKEVYICDTVSGKAEPELIWNKEAAELLRQTMLSSSTSVREYALIKALACNPLEAKEEFKTYSRPRKCNIF